VVTGGRPGPVHGNLATVERYDPGSRRWTTLPDLATPRSGHSTVAVGARLVAFGGEELDGGTTIEQAEVLAPGAGAWTPLPEMITPRHGVGGAARGKRVYALEGGPQPGLAFSSALEYLDLP
jgi:non-specific serine/threonine protein kinase